MPAKRVITVLLGLSGPYLAHQGNSLVSQTPSQNLSVVRAPLDISVSHGDYLHLPVHAKTASSVVAGQRFQRPRMLPLVPQPLWCPMEDAPRVTSAREETRLPHHVLKGLITLQKARASALHAHLDNTV